MSTTTHDNRTRRLMARNTLENAIVKAGLEDVYGAEAAYRQAQQFAKQALESAANDHQSMAADRLLTKIAAAFADFSAECQPGSNVLERMGPASQEHIASRPEPERNIVLKIIANTDRINDINRELAQLRARAGAVAPGGMT